MNQPVYDPGRPRLRAFPGGRSLDRSNPIIYLGTIAGVKKARKRKGSLICPLDADPLAFEWPVAGLSVCVIADDGKEAEAKRLALALMRDKAELTVVVFGPSGNSLYRRRQHDSDQIVE